MGWGSLLGSIGGGALGSIIPGIGTQLGAGLGGSLGGLIDGNSATSDALDAQKAASERSDATQRYMYDTTRQDNMPGLDARNASLAKMRELLGIGGDTKANGYGSLGGPITPQNVQNDPGYQFGMQQGMQGLNNQLSARGMRNSGAALKAASRYATDYGTTKFNDAFNREATNRNAQLNPLQTMAGLGQSGASTIAGAGQNYANQVSSNAIGLGNAQASAGINNALNSQDIINKGVGWYLDSTKAPGFNGNALSGYTNQTPWAVGPQLGG